MPLSSRIWVKAVSYSLASSSAFHSRSRPIADGLRGHPGSREVREGGRKRVSSRHGSAWRVGGVVDGGKEGPDVLGFGCLEKALLLVVDMGDAELFEGGAYLLAVPAASGQDEDLFCGECFFFAFSPKEEFLGASSRDLLGDLGAERFLGFGQLDAFPSGHAN